VFFDKQKNRIVIPDQVASLQVSGFNMKPATSEEKKKKNNVKLHHIAAPNIIIYNLKQNRSHHNSM